jgi:hypothetical protein
MIALASLVMLAAALGIIIWAAVLVAWAFLRALRDTLKARLDPHRTPRRTL